MFPKAPLSIHTSLVQRDVGSGLPLPPQGCELLSATNWALETIIPSLLCLRLRSPSGDKKRPPLGRSSIQASRMAHGQGHWTPFFPPRQVQLLCSKTKANNGHPSSHGEHKKEKSRKPAFENRGCWTPSSSRAWLQPTFWQPQRSTVLVSKTMSALKETTKREREAFQRLWKNV